MYYKRIISVFLLTSFIFILPKASAEYYTELLEKRVKIHGPSNLDTVSLALEEKMCGYLQETLHPENLYMFKTMLNSYKIVSIRNDSPAIVKNLEILNGRAKVIMLTCPYKGLSGWIPLEWLNRNNSHLRFQDVP